MKTTWWASAWMGRGASLAALAAAWTLLPAGCADDPDRTPGTAAGTTTGSGTGTTTGTATGTGTGTGGDGGAPPQLPSSCTEPELPEPLGSSHVVGDGTAASCTRDAIATAVESGGDVTFDCGAAPVTIPVPSQVHITADTILDGGGQVTLDGGGTSRILDVDNHVSLTVVGLSFVNGHATSLSDDRASGGAIRGGWRGTVSAYDCAFDDNAAGAEGEEGGGAIYVPSASTLVIVGCSFQRNSGGLGGAVHNLLSGLTIVNSSFVDNSSDNGGGAVYTDGASEETDDAIGGVIDICGCQFVRNQTFTQGGGAYLFAYPPDEILINQTVFDSNTVFRRADGGALGGGLRPGNATLQLENSLFVDNHADVHGGGLWVDGNLPSNITNTTFTRNDAGVSGQEGGYGGAISGGNLTLTNVTIANNHAEHSGGAIFNESSESVTLQNSILAGNSASNPWDLDHSCRDPMQGSHNLQWPAPTDGDLPCTADVIAEDPLLDALADNGGPTATMALPSGSPAIDAGDGCPETDQRGLPRVQPCDLGAFEAQ